MCYAVSYWCLYQLRHSAVLGSAGPENELGNMLNEISDIWEWKKVPTGETKEGKIIYGSIAIYHKTSQEWPFAKQ